MDVKRKLLSLIQMHEVIYNTELLEHKDQASRTAAWMKVAEIMNMPVEDCKTEWGKLRNCYVNALRRRVSLQKRAGKSLPPWVYEAEMNFLKPFMTGRSYDDTPYTVLLPQNYEIEDDTDIDSMKNEDALEIKLNRKHFKKKKSPKLEQDTYQILDTSNNGEMLMSNGYNEPYTEDYKIKSQGILGDMDESDLFFLGLSQTFKKLPKIEQCALKMEIFKILNDAEMRQLEGRKRKIPNRRSSSE